VNHRKWRRHSSFRPTCTDSWRSYCRPATGLCTCCRHKRTASRTGTDL